MKHVILALITILSMYLIYLGILKSLYPPVLTGIGFLLTIVLFLSKDNK